jgi:hypothetical protein
MANPNFLELEWKTRRALDIVEAHDQAESSVDYRSALQTALRRFKRMTRETDSIYRDWRSTRGERMKTFRELRRESDRAKDLCDEHAMDDYPDQKIAYTEEEHLEELIDMAVEYLEEHKDEWDWISDKISTMKSLRSQGDELQAKAEKLYEQYTVKVKERVASYDHLHSILADYINDASQDVDSHELWPQIQLKRS